ncbi:hypothetical protein ACSS6W_007687 [Trichoderma asperelloides]
MELVERRAPLSTRGYMVGLAENQTEYGRGLVYYKYVTAISLAIFSRGKRPSSSTIRTKLVPNSVTEDR